MYFKRRVVRQTFHKTYEPVARKAWRCSLCGQPVTVGERFVRYVWRQEERIDDLPFHPQCWSIVKAYCKKKKTNFVSPAEIYQYVRTRTRACRSCEEPVCNMAECEQMRQWSKHKPLLTYYDKLKPMPEEEEKPDETMFKIIEEDQ